MLLIVFSYSQKGSSIVQDLIYLCVIAGIIYIIYKTCIATPTVPSDAPPPYDAHDRYGNRQQPSAPPQPPPYGFRQDYMPPGGKRGSQKDLVKCADLKRLLHPFEN